jgi:hypothetical protein
VNQIGVYRKAKNRILGDASAYTERDLDRQWRCQRSRITRQGWQFRRHTLTNWMDGLNKFQRGSHMHSPNRYEQGRHEPRLAL